MRGRLKYFALLFLVPFLACSDNPVEPDSRQADTGMTQPVSADPAFKKGGPTKPSITFAALRGWGCGVEPPWLEWEAVADTDKEGLGLVFAIQTPSSAVYREINYGYPGLPGYYSVRHQITVQRGTYYRMTAELFKVKNEKSLDTAVTEWVKCD